MTAVQTKPNGRLVSTIPADQLYNITDPNTHDLEIVWHVESRDRLRLQLVTESDDRPTTKLRHDPHAGSYTTTIPRYLGCAMHLVDAELEWETKRGNLYATAVSRGEQDD